MSDEKDQFGRIPLRTEVSVLPPVDPNRRIGWTIQQYEGAEVYRFAPDGSVNKAPLTALEDIHEGVEIAVPGFRGGYHKMVVERVQGRSEPFIACSDQVFAPLRWDIDDRHCWTVTNLIHKDALKALANKAQAEGT